MIPKKTSYLQDAGFKSTRPLRPLRPLRVLMQYTETAETTAFTKPLCIEENKDNDKWTHGWVVAPVCARTTNKPLECIDIGAGNYVANLGIVTAIFGALHCLLSGVHTFNAIEEQSKTSKKNSWDQLITEKRLHGFNIFWSIIGIVLCIISGLAWNGLCDKIDSGLGRTEQDVFGMCYERMPMVLWYYCNVHCRYNNVVSSSTHCDLV